MCKFLKRRRVIKECDSIAGDADNSVEVRVEESQASDKFHYNSATRGKARPVSTIKATY
jgi:hypothetical protein